MITVRLNKPYSYSSLGSAKWLLTLFCGLNGLAQVTREKRGMITHPRVIEKRLVGVMLALRARVNIRRNYPVSAAECMRTLCMWRHMPETAGRSNEGFEAASHRLNPYWPFVRTPLGSFISSLSSTSSRRSTPKTSQTSSRYRSDGSRSPVS